MKILVTGSSGFIASHLIDRLISEHEVTGLDRRAGIRTQMLMDCRSLLYGSWPDFDFVYHLASTIGVNKVLQNPADCIANIIEPTRAVLSLGVPGIYFSTSEVYGRNTGVLSEDSEIRLSSKARWSYAAAKLCGEWMALEAGWKVVRLFNVVGPRQSEESGAVLPRFVKQALRGEPITVYGEGTQIRTFIDVKDCVEILDRLRDKTFDVVNIAGTHLRTILTLAKEVRETLDSPSPIEQVPYSKAHPDGFEECEARIPDSTKLYDLIGRNFKFKPLDKTIKELACTLTKNPSDQAVKAPSSWTPPPAASSRGITI